MFPTVGDVGIPRSQNPLSARLTLSKAAQLLDQILCMFRRASSVLFPSPLSLCLSVIALPRPFAGEISRPKRPESNGQHRALQISQS